MATVATRRPRHDILPPQVKSLNYLNNVMAKVEAIQAGAEEGLMLNDQGLVAECTGDNIFIIRDGKIATPELTSALDGITWRSIQTVCADWGIPVEARKITRDDVYIADEAFFTGTAAEVTPIRELDGRVIGNGVRGPSTEKLQSAFFDIVYGRNPKYHAWLSPVKQ